MPATLDNHPAPASAATAGPPIHASLGYINFVHGIALRQTRGDTALAADITQAVFLVLLKQRSALRDQRALPAWLHRVTLRTAARLRRDAVRRQRYESAAARPEVAMQFDSTAQREQLAQLDAAISKLGSGDRRLILMRYLQGQDVSSIAAVLGIAQTTARKRVTRAVERLRHMMGAPAPAVDAALAMTAAHVAPPAVHAAITSLLNAASAAPSVSALARGISRSLLLHKLALPVMATFSTLVLLGGVVVVESRLPSPPTLAAARPATPSTLPTTHPATRPTSRPATRMSADQRAAILAQLKAAYGLRDGQNVRLVFPPFAPVRQRFWGNRYSSVFFAWQNENRYASGAAMGDISFSQIIDELYIPWWNVENLNAVHWTQTNVDVSWRFGSSAEQRLTDMLDIIHQHTGEQFELLQRKETRPCIVVHQRSTKVPFTDRADHRAVLVLTQTSWGPDQQALYDDKKGKGYPAGTTEIALTADLPDSRKLDAPFLDPQRLFAPIRHVIVAPDALLDHHDPDYLSKLQHIVDNVNKQLGGDWRVEQREIIIYHLEPAKL